MEAAAEPILAPLGPLTEDVFLGGKLTLRQPGKGLRGGIDGVLLAASVPAEAGASVLDAGAGSGLAGLALAARVSQARATLIEIEPALAALAIDNARVNGLLARIEVITADVTAPLQLIAEAGAEAGSFDHVFANPPYGEEGRMRISADGLRARATAMASGGIERWTRFLAAMARPGGTATMIHRADALGEVLAAFESRFGAIKAFPLYPRDSEAAIRVIVQGIKGSRAPFRLERGLVLHDAKGRFSTAADAILRHGAALHLGR